MCLQFLKQLHKLLGSVDFLGNPVAIASQIGTGLKDFFYEPSKAMMSNPQDFMKVFAKGGLSLLKNTTSAVFDGASKMTGAIAKGLARFTDDEFMKVAFVKVICFGLRGVSLMQMFMLYLSQRLLDHSLTHLVKLIPYECTIN